MDYLEVLDARGSHGELGEPAVVALGVSDGDHSSAVDGNVFLQGPTRQHHGFRIPAYGLPGPDVGGIADVGGLGLDTFGQRICCALALLLTPRLEDGDADGQPRQT